MILRSLTLINFKQYRDLELDFPEGLIGIVGKNGSGKSTIFEAVLWALYGEIFLTREQTRNAWAGEKDPISASLVFEIGGREYRVLREYRGKALTAHSTLYDSADSVISSGQKEVTTAVERLLGMGYDAFTRSIFSGQKELGAISAATGGDRRVLIRRMIGMDRVDDILRKVRDDRNILRNEIKGQESMLLREADISAREKKLTSLGEEMQSLSVREKKERDNLARVSSEYVSIKEQYEAHDALFRKYSDMKGSLGKLIARGEGVDKQIAGTSGQLEVLLKEKKEMEALEKKAIDFTAVQKESKSLDEARLKYLKKEATARQALQLEKDIAKVTADRNNAGERLAVLETLKARIEEVDANRAAVEAEIAGHEKALSGMRADLGGIRMRIKERQESIKKISDAGRDSECPTCLRPLSDSFDSTMEKLDMELSQYQEIELRNILGRIQDMEKSLKKGKERLRECENEQGRLRQEGAALKEVQKQIHAIEIDIKEKNTQHAALQKEIAMLGDVRYNEEHHREVASKMKELEPINLRYHQYRARVEQVPLLEKQLCMLREEKNSLLLQEKKLGEELEKLGYSAEDHEKTRTHRDECEARRDAVKNSCDIFSAELQKLRLHIEALNNELKQDRENRKRVEKNIEELETLNRLELFFDDFRNVVLERVKPAIAGHAGSLFSRITSGRYEAISVDSDFDFFIQDEGRLYPVRRFSGGEVDCANLCLRIAISRTVRDLAGGGSIGFLGFDEIFGSQDLDRRREIMNALLYLKEMYRQIFIISHVEEIREEFPHVLHVSRTDAGSRVQWLSAD